MKKSIFILMALLMTVVVPNIGYADDWRDIEFDFNTVNKIYIDKNITYSPGFGGYELMKLKNAELMDEYRDKLEKYQVVDRKELADAIVSVNIRDWRTNTVEVDERYYTEDAQIKHYDTQGNKTTRTVTFDMYHEGYSYIQCSFYADFKLTDVKTGKVIYTKDTYSVGSGGGPYDDMYDEYDMFKDEVKEFYKELDFAKW